MKTIAITGASGFVGTSLTKYFSDLGYKIIPISRDILNDNKKLEE
ncbi:MAG: NAD-dependent epimerase/dehydratase family protein, partial [Aliarcobacter sp.]|nr:NAD-dependent epimerase/dehydratase family protein [Aliarcobacter sp.]